VDFPGAHSSKAMIMSAPRSCWICIAFSGVMKCLLPSMCDLNSTPFSVIFTKDSFFADAPNEKTWKPPESVRIGRSQFIHL